MEIKSFSKFFIDYKKNQENNKNIQIFCSISCKILLFEELSRTPKNHTTFGEWIIYLEKVKCKDLRKRYSNISAFNQFDNFLPWTQLFFSNKKSFNRLFCHWGHQCIINTSWVSYKSKKFFYIDLPSPLTLQFLDDNKDNMINFKEFVYILGVICKGDITLNCFI